MWIKKKNRPISTVFFIGLSAFELVKLSEHKSPRIREQHCTFNVFSSENPAILTVQLNLAIPFLRKT